MTMAAETWRLKEFAGQCCDVVITKRDDGSVFVVFRSTPSFGYPCLELKQLRNLLRRCEAFEGKSDG